jgi:predicted mannosyl-3-phosphoglycerate phosphatase (HAD superfamily)
MSKYSIEFTEKQTAIRCLEIIAENGSYKQYDIDLFNKVAKEFNVDVSYVEIQNNLEMRKENEKL